jgi:hypothetical protein
VCCDLLLKTFLSFFNLSLKCSRMISRLRICVILFSHF